MHTHLCFVVVRFGRFLGCSRTLSFLKAAPLTEIEGRGGGLVDFLPASPTARFLVHLCFVVVRFGRFSGCSRTLRLPPSGPPPRHRAQSQSKIFPGNPPFQSIES